MTCFIYIVKVLKSRWVCSVPAACLAEPSEKTDATVVTAITLTGFPALSSAPWLPRLNLLCIQQVFRKCPLQQRKPACTEHLSSHVWWEPGIHSGARTFPALPSPGPLLLLHTLDSPGTQKNQSIKSPKGTNLQVTLPPVLAQGLIVSHNWEV